MRPVDKGPSPRVFTDYHDARDPLIKAIGDYCSYCERPCDPDVEHVKPKSTHPSEALNWENFLLACSTCNRQKWDQEPYLISHLFPDEVNTAYAFVYDEASNKIKSGFDPAMDQIKHQAAERTLALLDMNRLKDSRGREDRRWLKRLGAWGEAKEARVRHLANLPISTKDVASIVALAKQTGFFGIWMSVFSDQDDVRGALIQAFPGTRTRCYDASGAPLQDLRL